MKKNLNFKTENVSDDGKTTVTSEAKFSKEQLISSGKYSSRRDALSVLLADDTMYTQKEVDRILNVFMKGKV